MRLSKFSGREIVNLNDGSRLGLIEDADLLIDPESGKIDSILVYETKNQFFLKSEKNLIRIPWDNIKKIGNEMIIVDIDYKYTNNRIFNL